MVTLELDPAMTIALEETARLFDSSLHVLFPTEPERQMLESAGFLTRKACQFHWANDGYRDFDEFLGRFSADKRKTYCLYEAERAEAIRNAARRNDIPADVIIQVDEITPAMFA